MSEKKVIKIKNNIKTSEEVIIIKNLKLNAKFGYYPHEKITKQELVFNLKIFTNENLYQDNSLNEIIDYDQIIKIIKKILNEDINFLETLSEKIITKIFDDQRVNKVKIRIEKTQAVKECESVGYEITKKRI
ncbi:MAG: dihydroneopterin aldolase [Pelagibacteraceae bacterium]|jgi:dihydroneopterin aldolase|uniref:dihydroneopterin aldolase n=1 Tax=unclassified Candidatus Pelagibacter TaxID=2647897 RepID=UPI0001BB45E2|nr:FolB domain protein [alpha proteobacterium HIMB114]MCI5053696.1 dihydroneopterin aldolase [Pelagibacteraceae bacterium]MCI5079522.1 dihydroneopterin aldolase [Pelagibacteraceae bacterium]|tara:strand:+ start:661 stop:1056 length:396 start_codon:yes stop_codon:yes gene_type:complete